MSDESKAAGGKAPDEAPPGVAPGERSVGEMNEAFSKWGMHAGLCAKEGHRADEVSTACPGIVSIMQALQGDQGFNPALVNIPAGLATVAARYEVLAGLRQMKKDCNFEVIYAHCFDAGGGGAFGKQALALKVYDKDGNEITTLPPSGVAKLFPGDSEEVRKLLAGSLPSDALRERVEMTDAIFAAKDRNKRRILRAEADETAVSWINHAGNGRLLGKNPTPNERASKLQAIYNPEHGAMDPPMDPLPKDATPDQRKAWNEERAAKANAAKYFSWYIEFCDWLVAIDEDGGGGLPEEALGWKNLGDNTHDDFTAAVLEIVSKIKKEGGAANTVKIRMFRDNKKGELHLLTKEQEKWLDGLDFFMAINSPKTLKNGRVPKRGSAKWFLAILDMPVAPAGGGPPVPVVKTVAFPIAADLSIDVVNGYLSNGIPHNGTVSGMGKVREILKHVFATGRLPDDTDPDAAAFAIDNASHRLARVLKYGIMAPMAS